MVGDGPACPSQGILPACHPLAGLLPVPRSRTAANILVPLCEQVLSGKAAAPVIVNGYTGLGWTPTHGEKNERSGKCMWLVFEPGPVGSDLRYGPDDAVNLPPRQGVEQGVWNFSPCTYSLRPWAG